MQWRNPGEGCQTYKVQMHMPTLTGISGRCAYDNHTLHESRGAKCHLIERALKCMVPDSNLSGLVVNAETADPAPCVPHYIILHATEQFTVTLGALMVRPSRSQPNPVTSFCFTFWVHQRIEMQPQVRSPQWLVVKMCRLFLRGIAFQSSTCRTTFPRFNF